MNHHKILVVDADQACARLVQGHLEAAGYDVLTAYSGEDALLTARHEQPDLVVLDLTIPRWPPHGLLYSAPAPMPLTKSSRWIWGRMITSPNPSTHGS